MVKHDGHLRTRGKCRKHVACVAGGIRERASGRAAIFPPWRSPRGNSRAAKLRVKFNQTLHQSSHGFATRVHGFAIRQKKHSRAKSRQLRRLENTSHRRVFSTFLECSQMSGVFYHNVIHGLGFFICFMI